MTCPFSVQCWSQTIHETRQPFVTNRKRPRKFRDTGVCTGAPWMRLGRTGVRDVLVRVWEENTPDKALKRAWIWWVRGLCCPCENFPWGEDRHHAVTRKAAGLPGTLQSEERCGFKWEELGRQHGWEFNRKTQARKYSFFSGGGVFYKLWLRQQ